MKSIITQTLVSVQGEGYGIGKPILLIRFGGCNFTCSFCDSSWTNRYIDCDTFSPLKNNKTPFIVDIINIDLYVNFIQKTFLDKYNIKTVLFTGGEPFQNLEFIRNFINISDSMDYFDLYEIETNGSLLFENLNFIIDYKDRLQLNISPKQTEYFESYTLGFKNVLNYINRIYELSPLKNSSLKFVYRRDLEEDIISFIKKFKPDLPIYMMPLTPENNCETQEDIDNFRETWRLSCLDTVEFCLKTGYRYSAREHVFLFGTNREEFESLKS